MSTLLHRLNFVLFIFLLQTINRNSSAPINTINDYNNFDINNKDSDKDYWNEDKTNSKDAANNGVYYFQECKPITTSTTIAPTSAIPIGNNTDSERPSANDAQDVVNHVLNILRSMKKHAAGLVKNMNDLEMDILTSSSSSDRETSCKHSSNVAIKASEGVDKTVYPDVLSQKPDYIINNWSVPLKVNSASEVGQTNEFLTEAHAAVKSWKKQIDACKDILDNAVHNAVRNVHLKSSIAKEEDLQAVKEEPKYSVSSSGYYKKPMAIGYEELSKDLKQEQEEMQNVRSDKKYKFHSMYDAFRTKDDE